LSRFLDAEREKNPDTFPDLSLTIVKLMGPGEYIARDPKREPVGHFALAVTDYTHSTAPNRRYTDLIIQRLVKSAIDGDDCPYTFEDLEEESAWLSDREKGSKKVERFMRKAAAAMLLEDRVGETFEAFVTGASERGTYVRLIQPPVEGRVMRGEQCLKVGHKVMVRLVHTDPEKGFVDFECLGKRPSIRRFR
jgi:exoribonuclease-2